MRSVRPKIQAKAAKAIDATAASPVARPSSPSVRLTALLLPVITTVTKRMKSSGAKLTTRYLKNGSVVAVAGRIDSGTTGLYSSSSPSRRPNPHWPTSFHLATSPRDLPCTIFR